MAGKAILNGPVVYDPSISQVIVNYSPTVPDEWLAFIHPENKLSRLTLV